MENLNIRWLIRRDMSCVLAIEAEGFGPAWAEEDFLCCLRQRNVIGMVAEVGDEIMGYMIYKLHKDQLHLVKLVVAPQHRGKGVGAQLIRRLKDKLSQQKRNHLTFDVRERNLDGQLFLKSQGFRATEVLRDYFEEDWSNGFSAESAYVMRYDLTREDDIYHPLAPANRISEYYG